MTSTNLKWMGRLIVTQDGRTVDLPPDRQEIVGEGTAEEKVELLKGLEALISQPMLFDIIRSKLVSGEIKTRERKEVVLLDASENGERWLITANANASAGYLYVEARVTGPDLEPPTFRVLDLSTAHLPPVYRNNLNDLGPVTAYEMPYGWLLYVPEDIDEIVAQFAGSTDPFDECLDEFLVTIWRYAHRWGCRYVMFDMDADPIGALPTFDD